MLHELLLALSGYPSPLLSPGSKHPLTTHLSPAEATLLHQLSHLGTQHAQTRSLASQISHQHQSTICRAVSSSILNDQLARFQDKILDVEHSVLANDASYVGAYNIVPLSGIAAAFTGWSRRLQWMRALCERMIGSEGSQQGESKDSKRRATTGAETLDYLRKESKTGFPDLEVLVLELVAVAEQAWLRQVATWILYGRLPAVGATDFMIQATNTASIANSMTDGEAKLEMTLVPDFVTSTTARSILFVGKSLSLIKNLGVDSTLHASTRQKSLTEHYSALSSLSHPLSSTSLARTVMEIRSSLARNALQQILPVSDVIRLLKVLQEFFLLARGEFSVTLVDAADKLLYGRYLKADKKTDALRLGGVMIKDSEVASVLSKTWATLLSLQDINDDSVDETLEVARDIIKLNINKNDKHKDETDLKKLHTIFDDTLLATPAILSINIAAPLNLFLTKQDTEAYSTFHSYLLSIRRTHMHLTELWKSSVLRRQHPASARSNHVDVMKRSNQNSRNIGMRSVWAAISSATFFLTEFGEYLQGEVIAESWSTFETWLQKDNDGERDPEILASAHRLYIAGLVKSLILDDMAFARTLRDLLGLCDQTVAMVRRLEVLRQTLQSFEAGSSASPSYMLEEERELLQNQNRLTQSISQSLKDITARLNDMDTERIGSSIRTIELTDEIVGISMTFVPWKGSGVRSLLIRLDLRRMIDD